MDEFTLRIVLLTNVYTNCVIPAISVRALANVVYLKKYKIGCISKTIDFCRFMLINAFLLVFVTAIKADKVFDTIFNILHKGSHWCWHIQIQINIVN